MFWFKKPQEGLVISEDQYTAMYTNNQGKQTKFEAVLCSDENNCKGCSLDGTVCITKNPCKHRCGWDYRKDGKTIIWKEIVRKEVASYSHSVSFNITKPEIVAVWGGSVKWRVTLHDSLINFHIEMKNALINNNRDDFYYRFGKVTLILGIVYCDTHESSNEFTNGLSNLNSGDMNKASDFADKWLQKYLELSAR